MNEAQRLAQAEAEHDAACAEVIRLRKEAEAAIKAAEEIKCAARAEMDRAQLAADNLLPICTRYSRSGRSGLTVDKLVIVKRTPKSASVKLAGWPDDSTILFKAGKDGVYRISPNPTGYWAPTIWIEFPEESPSATDPA